MFLLMFFCGCSKSRVWMSLDFSYILLDISFLEDCDCKLQYIFCSSFIANIFLFDRPSLVWKLMVLVLLYGRKHAEIGINTCLIIVLSAMRLFDWWHFKYMFRLDIVTTFQMMMSFDFLRGLGKVLQLYLDISLIYFALNAWMSYSSILLPCCFSLVSFFVVWPIHVADHHPILMKICM